MIEFDTAQVAINPDYSYFVTYAYGDGANQSGFGSLTYNAPITNPDQLNDLKLMIMEHLKSKYETKNSKYCVILSFKEWSEVNQTPTQEISNHQIQFYTNDANEVEQILRDKGCIGYDIALISYIMLKRNIEGLKSLSSLTKETCKLLSDVEKLLEDNSKE